MVETQLKFRDLLRLASYRSSADPERLATFIVSLL